MQVVQEPDLIQELLSTAESAITNPVSDTRSLAAGLLPRLRARQEKLLQDASGNPETDEESLATALQAFERCEQTLERLLDALGEDAQTVRPAAEALYDAASDLRSQRKSWASGLQAMGPTPFPDANRVFFEVRILRDGYADIRHALLALADLETFESRTAADIVAWRQRSEFSETAADATAAAVDTGSLARRMQEVLQTQWADFTPEKRGRLLEEVERRLTEYTTRLAQAWGRYAEVQVQGPTPHPAINTVLHAVYNLQDGVADDMDFVAAVEEVEAAGDLDTAALEEMESLKNWARTGDLEALYAHIPDVQALGSTSRPARPADDDDDDIVLDFIHGAEGLYRPTAAKGRRLPDNTQRVVDAVAAYMKHHTGSEAAATQAVEALSAQNQSVRAAISKMTLTGDMESQRGAMGVGHDAVDEGIESLRAAIEMQSLPALEAATESLERAADIFGAIVDSQAASAGARPAAPVPRPGAAESFGLQGSAGGPPEITAALLNVWGSALSRSGLL